MQNKMVVNVLVRYQRALKYVIVKYMRLLYRLLELNKFKESAKIDMILFLND